MAISADVLEKIRTEEDVPELDLSWLKPDDARKVERVHPGRRGLTFDEIEKGRDVPEHTDSFSILPRDATPPERCTAGRPLLCGQGGRMVGERPPPVRGGGAAPVVFRYGYPLGDG